MGFDNNVILNDEFGFLHTRLDFLSKDRFFVATLFTSEVDKIMRYTDEVGPFLLLPSGGVVDSPLTVLFFFFMCGSTDFLG